MITVKDTNKLKQTETVSSSEDTITANTSITTTTTSTTNKLTISTNQTYVNSSSGLHSSRITTPMNANNTSLANPVDSEPEEDSIDLTSLNLSEDIINENDENSIS